MSATINGFQPHIRKHIRLQQEQPKTLEYAKRMARTREKSKTLVTTTILNLEAELQIKNIVSEKSGISKETDSQI
jgi:hypothetical protein